MAPCAELDASEDQRIQAYATADAAELQVGLHLPCLHYVHVRVAI